MRKGPPLAMPEFFAPLPLLAVGLMVLNDRVLKPRLHNALSGKLSDVAVCFFLPLFVSALLGFVWKRHPRARIVVGAAIAGLFYVAQETWKGFEQAFLAVLRVVGAPLGLEHFALWSDASDLWALLMVPLAVAYGFHRVARDGRPASGTGSGPPATSLPGSRRGDDP